MFVGFGISAPPSTTLFSANFVSPSAILITGLSDRRETSPDLLRGVLVEAVGKTNTDAVWLQRWTWDAGYPDCARPDLIFVIGSNPPVPIDSKIDSSASSHGEIAAVRKLIGKVNHTTAQQELYIG